MSVCLQKDTWSLTIDTRPDGIAFADGHFGTFSLIPSPVFHMTLEDSTGALFALSSESGWNRVRSVQKGSLLQFWLAGSAQYGDITVMVTGHVDDRGISWYTDVINHSAFFVRDITYPTPVLQGDTLHLFVPDCCGRAILQAGKYGFHTFYTYPGHNASMQYFAFWGEQDGLYLGIHDPDASMKYFRIDAEENTGRLHLQYLAPGVGCDANSFSTAGFIRWETFTGDWYDATLLYKEFVLQYAKWLPVKGRPDTPAPYKEIPYWICDYIPNSEKQMEARPMTLATVSERYGENYWVDAAAALKERLGTPVGYHIYNWHEIPFNINYPHFTPARETARAGMEKLKQAGLYVFPYINAVSWEMDDADEGFSENFATTGIHGAALQPDGKPLYVIYPQKKASGLDTRLAPICPTFSRWHQIMEEVTREIENTLPVDGIYFDQIAAVPSYPCRNPEHSHRPGGGSYWSDSYRLMMDKINAGKPEDKFYFSESNAEAYVKSFDGFLTWVWTMGDAVPAFPAIYTGYIQMLGRYTDGAKRDDDSYFRYHLAQSLLFGQQLGWLNAHVVYNEERMAFLEKLVHTRYAYTSIFNEGNLLRPPMVETNLPPVTSSGITMQQVLAGVWQTEDRAQTTLFVINVSDRPAEVLLHLYPEEYGVSCPAECRMTLEAQSIRILSY